MFLDEYYAKLDVVYPFRITRFRCVHDHHLDSTFVFPGECHNFWEAFLLLEGAMEIGVDQSVYEVKPDSLIFFPAMTFHRTRSIGQDIHALNFAFEYEGTIPPILSKGSFELNPAEIEELTDVFFRIYQVFYGDQSDSFAAAEAAYAMSSFLIRLSQSHTPQKRISQSRNVVKYQKLVETMQEHLYENISIQDLAEFCATSVSSMKLLFHTYAGISPKSYYCTIRGLQAERLLEEGTDIQEIVERMNYSSPNYFSLCFKKQFGMPPGQYRRAKENSELPNMVYSGSDGD